MDFKNILLLLAASQGLLLSLALLSTLFYHKWANFFLGLLTLFISIEIFGTWAIRAGYHESLRFFPYWNLNSYLIVPPSLYLFGKLTTGKPFHLRRIHFYLFVPAMVEILVETTVYYLNRYAHTSIHLLYKPGWFALTEIIPPLGLLGVLIIWAWDMYTLEKEIPRVYVTHARSHLLKIKVLYGFFVLLDMLWILEVLVGLPAYFITMRLLCIFLFALGYLCYFQPDFFQLPPSLLRNLSTLRPGEGKQEEIRRIQKAFREEGLYRRPKLSLQEASEHLGIGSRQLSELINTYFEVDFRRYVNSLRVEEVIRKMEAGEHLHKTLLGIALESGFNSKSSFNQAFKDLTGKSPTAYFKNA